MFRKNRQNPLKIHVKLSFTKVGPLVFYKAISWFALAVFAVKFNCVVLVFQGLSCPCLASKFHHLNWSHIFHLNYFNVVDSNLLSNLQSLDHSEFVIKHIAILLKTSLCWMVPCKGLALTFLIFFKLLLLFAFDISSMLLSSF